MILPQSRLQGESPELVWEDTLPRSNAMAANAKQECVAQSKSHLSPQAGVMEAPEAFISPTDTQIREETAGTKQRPRDRPGTSQEPLGASKGQQYQ